MLLGALSLVACQPPVVKPGAGATPSGEKPFYLPGEATPVYLPTQTVLPDAPREGIVINVPAMRLY